MACYLNHEYSIPNFFLKLAKLGFYLSYRLKRLPNRLTHSVITFLEDDPVCGIVYYCRYLDFMIVTSIRIKDLIASEAS